MDDRPTLRQRHRQQTKDEIETAAFALFQQHGYDATTVDQIAAAAAVSPRTFFRYFPSKEDVVFGDHDLLVGRLRAALRDTDPCQSPLLRLRQALLTVQAPGQHPERELLRARLVSECPAVRARSVHLIEDFEDLVTEFLVPRLEPRQEARARAMILAGAIFGALRGARRAASSLPNPDPQRLVETAFAVVTLGAERDSAACDPVNLATPNH